MSDKTLIEKYFDGEMTPVEAAQFLKEVEGNPELHRLYSQYQQIMQSIRLAGRASLKQRLSQVGTEMDRKKKRNNNIIILSIILGVCIVGGLLIYILSGKNDENKIKLNTPPASRLEMAALDSIPQKDSSDITQSLDSDQNIAINEPKKGASLKQSEVNSARLYNKYYTTFLDESLEPGMRGDSGNDYISKFKELYWDKKYLEAAKLFERFPAAAKNNDNLGFQYAMCLLEIKDYKAAEQVLKRIVKDENTRYEQAAKYYLALTLLKNKKDDRAKTLLTSLSNSKDKQFSKKAQRILDEY